MDIKEFKIILKENIIKINIELTEKQEEQLFNYMNLVLEWNKKINLTAIKDEKDFIIKHIIDSLTILPYIENNSRVIDVGTGAGFPGIPLKIANPTIKVTLLDSLNKRIKFLETVIANIDLKEIEAIHSRAEDAGKSNIMREQYDIAVARAVAPLNVLLEYLIPFVKINGECICMKSIKSEEEIKDAKKTLIVLRGTIAKNVEIILPKTDIKRNIIIIKKQKETPKTYPRKAGIPEKVPIS